MSEVLIWKLRKPMRVRTEEFVELKAYDALLAQAEAMEKALILSRSKITGYVSIANHELDLAELREDLKSAHQINKNALENWQKFKEQK